MAVPLCITGAQFEIDLFYLRAQKQYAPIDKQTRSQQHKDQQYIGCMICRPCHADYRVKSDADHLPRGGMLPDPAAGRRAVFIVPRNKRAAQSIGK